MFREEDTLALGGFYARPLSWSFKLEFGEPGVKLSQEGENPLATKSTLRSNPGPP